MSLGVKQPLELDYTVVLLRAVPPWNTLRYVRHIPLTISYWCDSKMAFNLQMLSMLQILLKKPSKKMKILETT